MNFCSSLKGDHGKKIWSPIDLVIYQTTQTNICKQSHTSEQMSTNILGGLPEILPFSFLVNICFCTKNFSIFLITCKHFPPSPPRTCVVFRSILSHIMNSSPIFLTNLVFPLSTSMIYLTFYLDRQI